MAHWLCPTAPGTSLLKPSISLLHPKIPKTQFCNFTISKNRVLKSPFNYRCSSSTTPTLLSGSESEYETEEEYVSKDDDDDDDEEEEEGSSSGMVGSGKSPPPMQRRRRRYRKQYPGEMKGITEEMRFVAMKLGNTGKKKGKDNLSVDDKELEKNGEKEENSSLDKESNQNGETWQPSVEGFLKYLVDSNLVFSTIERIVDESSDVSYVYFRKTGLERSECLSKDLKWFSQQGNVIPQPSSPGVTYAQYLESLAEKSPPLFLCHFYNIYFSHIAGGQVIAKQVSKKLLEERELEFYQWEGNAEELLKGVREKLNALGEHWSRDEKNKCLREATKAFRYLGQIVRLIIL